MAHPLLKKKSRQLWRLFLFYTRYTKLAELKLDLLRQAAADARKRCETILKEAGSDNGRLIKSSMGIFQITGQHSDEEYSYGGTLNTSNKEKTASITVTLEYNID